MTGSMKIHPVIPEIGSDQVRLGHVGLAGVLCIASPKNDPNPDLTSIFGTYSQIRVSPIWFGHMRLDQTTLAYIRFG